MRPFALLLLLPSLALGAAPAPRAAALLVALDPPSEASVPRLEAGLARALGAYPQLQLRSPEVLYGQPVDPAAQAALVRARSAYAEALAAYDAKRSGRAEERVRASLQEVQAAAPALRTCAPLCDATALLAALLLERGEREEAKRALLDLLALDPTYVLVPQRYRGELLALRAEVGTSLAALLRGSATVTSSPAGARVFLDGAPLGFTPLSIPALAAGAHLLRLERPGFRTAGQRVQVGGEEQTFAFTLAQAAPYPATRAQLEGVAKELATGAPSRAAVALGRGLGLERALLGNVRSLPGGAGSLLALGLYELQSGKRLALRRVKLQGDEFGQLEGEMERLVNQLLAAADAGEDGARPTPRSGDPLEHAQGTEDWSREDRGGRSRQAKPKAADPLDAVSGTEDW